MRMLDTNLYLVILRATRSTSSSETASLQQSNDTYTWPFYRVSGASGPVNNRSHSIARGKKRKLAVSTLLCPLNDQ